MTKYTELENNDIRSNALTDRKGKPLEKKRVLWPVVIRKGVFSSPQDEDDELTALDEFVICNLSEKEENKKEFIDKLAEKYSFNKTLLEKVIKTCNSYIEKSQNTIKLTKTGTNKKFALLNENPYGENTKDVLVFQDRVTGKYFPCFDYSQEGEEIDEENALIPDFDENKKHLVEILEFRKAYDTWKMLKKQSDDTPGKIEVSREKPDNATVDDQPRKSEKSDSSHSYNDEKDNEADKTDETGSFDNSLIREDVVDDLPRMSENDSSFSNAVGDLYSFCDEEEAEEEEMEEDNKNDTDGEHESRKAERIVADGDKKLFITSEMVKKRYLAFDVVFNPDVYQSPTVVTPFGKEYDEWFGRFLSLYLDKNNNRFSNEILSFTEECKDKYKDQIAYGKTWGIDILQQCPKLANYDEFEKLKCKIAGLYCKINDQQNYEFFRVDVLTDLRTIYELLFKAIIKANKSVIVDDLKKRKLPSKECRFTSQPCQNIISDYRKKIHEIQQDYYDQKLPIYNENRKTGLGLLSDAAYNAPWDACVYSDKTIRELLEFIWVNKGYINPRHEIAFLFLYLSFECRIPKDQPSFFNALQGNLNHFASNLAFSLKGNDVHEDNMDTVNEFLPNDTCGKTMKELFDAVCNDIRILGQFI